MVIEIFFWSGLKKCSKAAGAFLAMTALAGAVSAPAMAQNVTVDQLKQQLLSDPAFLEQLSAKIMQEEAAGKLVRDYLLKNPEVLVEMQGVLTAREEVETQKQQAEIIRQSSKTLFHSPDDVVFGNPDGDVTIVEFYDYNCGYCKRSFPTMQALLKNDPKIRFVMKDFPILGEDSLAAHKVARAFQIVMPQKYAAFHEKMMTYKGRATAESALAAAVSLGADKASINKALADKNLMRAFQNNGEIAYKLGINYTPSYIIGEQIVPGAVGADALVAIIAKERQ